MAFLSRFKIFLSCETNFVRKRFNFSSKTFRNVQNSEEILKPVKQYLKSSKVIKNNIEKKIGNPFGLEKHMIDKLMTTTGENNNDDDDNMMIDEDDVMMVTQQGEHFYDAHMKEEKLHKRMVKRKMILKKITDPVKEPPLITWRARQEIKYLNRLDPQEWTVQKLATCYPISRRGISKIFSSNFERNKEEEIAEYDENVARNWKLIKNGQLKCEHLNEWREDKPQHLLEGVNFQQFEKETKEKGPPGEFRSIIQPFLKKTVSKTVKENLNTIRIGQERTFEHERKATPSKENWVSVITTTTTEAGRSLRERKTEEKENTILKMEEKENSILRTEEKFREYSSPLKLNSKFIHQSETISKKWQIKKLEKEKFENEPGKNSKYLGEEIETRLDRDRSGQEQVYLYNNVTGYQHPIGFLNSQENNDDSERINIPKMNENDQSSIYRVGDSFYDQNGEFMYKINV